VPRRRPYDFLADTETGKAWCQSVGGRQREKQHSSSDPEVFTAFIILELLPQPMKVSVPCAAALALFPFVTAFPAPTAAPGELDIIKYGLNILEARGLGPRQVGVKVDTAFGVASTIASTITDLAPTSTSSSPALPSCAYQILVAYRGS
jgi:hypothetical protein